MLDAVVELVVDLGFSWVVDRNENRSMGQQICLFVGTVTVLLAIGLAIAGDPLSGVAAGLVGVALLGYGA
ncbi:hypothetical protein [Natrinema caseinilyticum]|uniref:hypothetical protein n=1 Tax=Natrinema caseinilyticum TaxID=2961570 RepID=UPI0020C40887|nr:hypothetical protein [Natrinema caseinilyticum]